MNDRIFQEIELFRKRAGSLHSPWTVESPGEDVYICHWGKDSKNLAEDPIDITFMGLTHGNEVYGVSVLNKLLALLADFRPSNPISMALILGNTKAALLGKRFVNHDLNRSFDSNPDPSSHERSRALELQPILEKTSYLLDLHQTIQPNETPFFIFPWKREAAYLASDLNPKIPIVTHWKEGSFSADGLCTDEFVNRCGGIGLTLETGQSGFDNNQIELAFSIVHKAVTILSNQEKVKQSISNRLYTWNKIVPYPSHDQVVLYPGLKNFSWVKAGCPMMKCDDQEVKFDDSGYVLFPKYLDASIPKQQRPSEIVRLLRSLDEEEYVNLGIPNKS